MNVENRFVLSLEMADVGLAELQHPQPSLVSHGNFYHALTDMFHFPLDIYSQQTAVKMGYPAFVQEATLTDAADGTTLVSLVRLNADKPVVGQTALFLELDQRVANEYFPHTIGFADPDRNVPAKVLLPFLAIEQQRMYLYPTKEFLSLYYRALPQFLDHERCFSPNRWSLDLEGCRVDKPIDYGDKVAFASITVQHMVSSKAEGLQLLLSQPSVDFDLRAANHSKRPFYFSEGSVYNLGDKSIAAVTEAVPLPKETDLHQAKDAGRYIIITSGWPDMLDEIGMPYSAANIPSYSDNALKLDYWNTAKPSRLQPTHLFEQIQQHLASKGALTATPNKYLSYIMTSPIPSDESLEQSILSKAERHSYYHTDDLRLAIYQVLDADMFRYDPLAASGRNIDRYTVGASVEDQQGNLLVAFKLERSEQEKQPGVYMHLQTNVLQDRVFADWGLIDIVRAAIQPSDLGDHWNRIQLGTYDGENLAATPLFYRIDQTFSANHLHLQTQRTPALLFPTTASLDKEDLFILSLRWQSMVPGAAKLYHDYHMGFPTLAAAAEALGAVADKRYSWQHQLSEMAHFSLEKAAVIEIASGQTLLSKYIKESREGPFLEINSKAISHEDLRSLQEGALKEALKISGKEPPQEFRPKRERQQRSFCEVKKGKGR